MGGAPHRADERWEIDRHGFTNDSGSTAGDHQRASPRGDTARGGISVDGSHEHVSDESELA